MEGRSGPGHKAVGSLLRGPHPVLSALPLPPATSREEGINTGLKQMESPVFIKILLKEARAL